MQDCDDATLRLREKAKEKVYAQFVKIYKVIFEHMKREDEKKEVRIDRHKIGAAMAVAILKIQPLILEADGDAAISFSCRLANEILAFGAALNILVSFINARARKDGDQATLDIFANGPKFPPCEQDYEVHIYRCFHYAMRSDRYDAFLLAHVLFWIENYTIAVSTSTIGTIEQNSENS